MSNQITPNPSVPSQVVQEVKFPKFVNNLGIIPTSYKDSMSYYECLAWLCKYLEETVIPTVNENGEAVEELQGLYIELNSYVAHYFDNLNVQEEINNKLDDLVADGTLTTLIANYIEPRIQQQNQVIDDLETVINTHTSQIANLVANASSTEENSELIDVRVAENGIIYVSAGESVREQVKNVKNDIIMNRETYDKHIYKSKLNLIGDLFELGGINTGNGNNISNSAVIRTKNYLTFNDIIQILEVEVTEGTHNVTLLVYNNDDTYINYFTLNNAKFQNISASHKFRITITNNNETVSNINSLLGLCNFYVYSFYNRSNDIYNIEYLNLINPSIVNKTAIINATTGYPAYTSGANHDGIIVPVEPTTQYYTNCNQYNASFFDKNMNFIEFHGNSSGNPLTSPFTTPNNAYYMGLTVPKSGLGSTSYLSKRNQYYDYGTIALSIKNNILASTRPDSKESVLKNKVINVFGDSISSTDYTLPYWGQILSSNTGCSVNNYGISGTTLAHTNDRHLYNYHHTYLNPEEIGYVENDPATWSTGNCFCERFTKVDNSADAIVIMGGTNDYQVPLGEWDSTDTSKFYGALNVLLQGISENMTGKKILICTPIQNANDYSNNIQDPLDSLKNVTSVVSLQKRATAIKSKCEQYGIPCLDLYNESGINGIDTNQIYYRPNDTIHPSSYGQVRIASLIQSKLEELFNN